jgi:transcriptional regulator with XRE-family HTH domain
MSQWIMVEKLARTRFKPTRKTFIREWREYRGHTLEELAEIVGCTAGAISNVERMTSGYTQGMLEALADALHCSTGELLERNPLDDGTAWRMHETLKNAPPGTAKKAMEMLELFLKAS